MIKMTDITEINKNLQTILKELEFQKNIIDYNDHYIAKKIDNIYCHLHYVLFILCLTYMLHIVSGYTKQITGGIMLYLYIILHISVISYLFYDK